MIIRIEEVQNTELVSVIDEIGRYLGDAKYSDVVEIVDTSKPITEDGYCFYSVDNANLNTVLKK